MKPSKNLLIGLGGTGQNVLLEVKRSLLREFGETPEKIVFLAIDTDVPYERKDPNTGTTIKFDRSEFLRLTGNGAVAFAFRTPSGLASAGAVSGLSGIRTR